MSFVTAFHRIIEYWRRVIWLILMSLPNLTAFGRTMVVHLFLEKTSTNIKNWWMHPKKSCKKPLVILKEGLRFQKSGTSWKPKPRKEVSRLLKIWPDTVLEGVYTNNPMK